MLLLIFGAIILILFVIYSLIIVKNVVKNNIILHKIPGPPAPYFLIGNLISLNCSQEKILNLLRKWAKLYYPIYKIYTFHVITVCILSPEDFELVLSNPKHNKKSRIYVLFMKWLNDGLLLSSDKKWQTRRKILTPSFHFNILQEFVEVFIEETDSLVAKLKEECHKPYIKVNSFITKFALLSIAETAMGTKLNKENEIEIEYKNSIHDIGELYVYRLVTPWLHLHFLYYYMTKRGRKERKLVKILHNFTKNVIKKRMDNFKGTNGIKKRLAMLDLLLSVKIQEGTIDDEGIREEVDTFMFEGHDTTTKAICFTLMLLACHKQVQDNILEEIHQVLGDFKTKPTYNDLQNLKYLERCIKESLRLYPSVHFISRILGDDLTTNSGYVLPKDTIVNLLIYDLHRNSVIYPDPDKFNPDRFLLENCQIRHPYAFVPFSAGSRNCIGQRFAILEMKTVLCGILRNFVLEPIDTPETVVLWADVILRTKEDIKVRFVPREIV